MPERIESTKFSYILLSSKSGQDNKVGDDSASSADRAVDGRIRLDPLFTRHLAGRNPLALASKYSYVVDAVILVFAAVVVVRRFGWTAYLAAIIAFGVIGHWIVYQSEFIQTLFRFASPLFGVFDSVDATLSNLAPKDGTRQFVTWLIKLDLWLASVPVGMLGLSLCIASIRPPEESLNLDGLRERRLVIRWALALAATLFVLAIIGIKVSVDWPLELLETSQADALRPVANGVILYAGANNTLVMITMFAPPLIAYVLDVRRYRAGRFGADQTAKSRRWPFIHDRVGRGWRDHNVRSLADRPALGHCENGGVQVVIGLAATTRCWQTNSVRIIRAMALAWPPLHACALA